ncbi:histidine kinase [Lachnospiraceae bacterium 66-29]
MQKFSRQNLDTKLRWYLSVLLVTIAVVVAAILTIFSARSSYRKAEEMAKLQLSFVTNTYKNWLDNNNMMLVALQMTPAIQEFCSLKDNSNPEYSIARSNVIESVMTQVNMNMDINFISVINQEMDSYVYSGNLTITKTRFDEIYRKSYEISERARPQGTVRIDFGNQFIGGTKHTVTFYQPVFSTEHLGEQLGMLCINMNDNMLKTMGNTDFEVAQVCLANQKGELISNQETELLSEDKQVKCLDFSGRDRGSVYQEGKYYFYQKIGGWQYYNVVVIPATYFYHSAVPMVALLLAAMATLLVTSITGVRRIVKMNYEPLAMVVSAMDHISNQELDYQIPTEDMGADFKKLGQGFNSMMEDIAKLMDQVRSEQKHLDQIRFNELQSQIQPHFLYNTLECIHWQASADGNKKVSRLILALASYYRLSLSKGKNILPLKEEIEHVKIYLVIQNERYGNAIKYYIDIPEKLYYVRILKLTLQPLVENSIYHGIRTKEGGAGIIRISALEREHEVIVMVEDNGTVMTQEQINTINRSVWEYGEQIGYGLNNVHKRIQLAFGEQYGLKYKLNQNGGTTVLIYLPKDDEVKLYQ